MYVCIYSVSVVCVRRWIHPIECYHSSLSSLESAYLSSMEEQIVILHQASALFFSIDGSRAHAYPYTARR